ncbi:pyridoxal-phosphate dependent enzyme [Streptomyces violascens]|uniref:Cystathionine beta-synthase n=2 Tax=Streptomyces violascens TaxID=67381 RepID=A0ABQ3QFF9_9ACTN|nr:pyridoxal-phosphate dependent enzyme [Streptomyces violascens]GGT86983.1 cystathionine beta-synthase [Streptomyces violascens]GHI36021.1 cystathionine beta-synthase [Streptomyces violascens]
MDAMDVYESALGLVGGTPLVRLRTGGAAAVYAKLEYLSIGGSAKDRIGLRMIEQAEKDGLLRPGGTVVEATSGNTGIGLALVAAEKGYRIVVVVSDRVSAEKVDTLRAFGAEVVVKPAGLPRQHPDHPMSFAAHLAGTTPGGWLADQYDNPANPEAHYLTTGPEIWRQTRGRVTHLVSCIGTGGTISGAGRYLKEVSDGAVEVIGADPASSVYSGGDGRPYFIEAAGHFLHPDTAEDVWPTSYHPGVVDRIVPVADREALDTLRRLARAQGLLAGGSSGTALAAAHRVAADAGPDAVVVVILPDSGRQYLSKYFNDSWMLRLGFLDGDESAPRVADAAPMADVTSPLPYLNSRTSVGDALEVLRARKQGGADPVLPAGPCPAGPDRRPTAPELTGSVTLAALEAALHDGTASPADPLSDHLEAPLPHFGYGEPAAAALGTLTGHAQDTAVVLRDGCAQTLIQSADLRALLPTPR